MKDRYETKDQIWKVLKRDKYRMAKRRKTTLLLLEELPQSLTHSVLTLVCPNESASPSIENNSSCSDTKLACSPCQPSCNEVKKRPNLHCRVKKGEKRYFDEKGVACSVQTDKQTDKQTCRPTNMHASFFKERRRGGGGVIGLGCPSQPDETADLRCIAIAK